MAPPGGRAQEPPPERRALPGTSYDDARGRGAVPEHASQARRRQEDHGDRRLHRLLPPGHRARHPRGRHDPGHGQSDINRENYELGLPCIKKAGVAHKVDFREGPALPVLDLLQDEKNLGSFDFVFVDADNYLNYHERLMKLVRLGGLVGYDNTLWNGSVVLPDYTPMRSYIRHYRDFVLQFNRTVADDDRDEICQLPVGDGITLCRRVK
ncbi:caffeoyl-CoA O-methyltransferase 1-like [Phragmites australis]|uniref:caffeoyl-CoA O-methyltransferase 1-like n=1 Tax=Phragmites australis TaxID=29695 RepID=UPI002D76E3B6|nr:caffeoyl-CoA O-methyltransferase 1-like [Phragmites australis]